MAITHTVSIDRAGRLVIPKAVRDELGIEPGQPLSASVRDGHLEIEAEPVPTELVEVDGILVLQPTEPVEVLTSADVRDAIDAVRP